MRQLHLLASLLALCKASPYGAHRSESSLDTDAHVQFPVQIPQPASDQFSAEQHRVTTQGWFQDGRHFIQQEGIVFERVAFPELPNYSLRLRSPQLCDSVKQYSGYLDVKDGAHSLFFWFFESRSSPDSDPLVLWLNGGPGCSSSTGLLFELGPCSILKDGKGTKYNKHSWNNKANIIFLDQPVDVGFSYSADGSTVNNSPAAALDVLSFLELFLTRFPKYSTAPFHLAAESYGGVYGPNIASIIHQKNKELRAAPIPNQPIINLASIVLANGLTEPKSQFGKVADYACNGPYPVFDSDSSECRSLYSKTKTCQRLVQSCYDYNSKLTCVPAGLYCWSQLFGSFQGLHLNPYDVRVSCDKAEDGDLCYRQMGWIEQYMNDPSVKAELGVISNTEFKSCNSKITQAFLLQGDGLHNSAALLPPLLEDGIRLLIYAGDADFMCNYMGNEAWMEALPSPFQQEFLSAPSITWSTGKGSKAAGRVRSANGGQSSYGNYSFVQIFDAGHMVPYDQPEVAQYMIENWLQDLPLV